MPDMDKRLGIITKGSGYWMIALLKKLATKKDIQIGVVTAWPCGQDMQFKEENIDYFIIGQPARFSHLKCRISDLEKCANIVRELKPNLIHVHGTERFYGLLTSRKLVNVPMVISIQGMLGPILPYYFGNMSLWEYFKFHNIKDYLRGRIPMYDYWLFKRGAIREQEIIKSSNYFLGRTTWDLAHIRKINPKSEYFKVGEILRDDYSRYYWNIRTCRRHTVIFTNAGSPFRGTEILLYAIKQLKMEYPDIKLRIAGVIKNNYYYGRIILGKIEKLGLKSEIELLGYLDSESMARALLESHVFCISSYIENSPNSLCEAQMIGIPCIASYAGGIPSLVKDDITGLLFPPGDSAVLAEKIREIFEDDELARAIGENAKKSALERHDSDRVVDQLLTAYSESIRLSKLKNNKISN